MIQKQNANSTDKLDYNTNENHYHLTDYCDLSDDAEYSIENNTVVFSKGTHTALKPLKHNPSWSITSSSLKSLLEDYTDEFKRSTGTVRVSKGLSAALICVLSAMVHSSKTNRPVKYTRKQIDRDKKTIIKVVDFMASKGLVLNVKGKANEYQECGSWYVATPKFKIEVEREKIRAAFAKDEKFLVLRSKKDKNGIKKDIKIIQNSKNVELLNKLSAPIQAYNLLWLNHSLTLDGLELIPFSYRIFNESKQFLYGGRAYRGEHLELKNKKPDKQRDRLKIDDCPTIEPDYSALHVYLLYALIGIQLPTDKDYDPYTMEGFDRDVIKLAFLKLINSKSEKAFTDGITRSGLPSVQDGYKSYRKRVDSQPWHKLDKLGKEIRLKENGMYKGFCEGMPRGIEENKSKKQKETSGVDGVKLLETIKANHPKIAHLFCTDRIGLKLQRLDSDIIMSAVHQLAILDKPVISVHDSIRCKVTDYTSTIDAMTEAYKLHTGGFLPKIT